MDLLVTVCLHQQYLDAFRALDGECVLMALHERVTQLRQDPSGAVLTPRMATGRVSAYLMLHLLQVSPRALPI